MDQPLTEQLAAGASLPDPASRAPGFIHWLIEGARTLLFKRPRWERLTVSPARLAWLVVLELLLTCAVQRIFIPGPADFHWKAATAGWAHTILVAWACYVLIPRPRAASQPGAAGPAALLALLLGQSLCMTVYGGLLFLVLLRTGALTGAAEWVHWLAWLAPVAWITGAALTAMLRESAPARPLAKAFAFAAVMLSVLLTYLIDRPEAFWRVPVAALPARPAPPSPAAPPDEQQETEEGEEGIRLTQEVFEAQAPLLPAQLAALKPQRPGVIDMYTITFAPFEGEEVFRRESRVVADVMSKRFDAAGRGLQLINHRETAAELPWATPLNLERAIAGLSKVMDPKEDVLFIHLTSHGASDGELAADFWPLEVEPVVPAALKYWLDKAGIKHRVLSISACYAGNWVAPLSGEDTLVMTASDADHTSYGCGKKSDLTFFGRAMYDEQLRTSTLSFEDAHAAARKIILQREKEAGKDDGYSNPQIKVGKRIRATLERQREQLAGSKSAG